MFRVIGIIALGLDILLWGWLCRRLLDSFPRVARLGRAGAVAAFVVLFHPALVMAFGGWPGLRAMRGLLPDAILMAGMAVQVATWLSLLAIGLGYVLRSLFRGVLALRARAEKPARGEAAPERVNEARRRIVAAGALAVPAVALAASGGGVIASRLAPSVVRVRLPVRREFTALHGVTIAQVSDVHVGSYMDAARLAEIRDAINALGADYHVITGDLLDNHVSQLEPARTFVRGLAPRRGEVFMCMGNHEYIAARSADVGSIVRGLEEAGAQVLVDEARELRIGADRLWMGAIDYPPSSRLAGRSARSTRDSLRLVLDRMRDDGAPRIVLSHHPRTFVEARELDLDLMLSGHTHGGQIKLGRVGEHALTPVLPFDFYHNGLYRHGRRQLYVNAGAGGWLPVRINCPPEITLVELVAA